jgi:medium-chain acyl-[acyl-carrier-protein] hydrolase
MGPLPNGPTWFVRSRRTEAPKLRLFCLPYAGGGAGIYRSWFDEFPSTIEVCAVQLPGREQRFAEPPVRDASQAASALAAALAPYLDEPFAFFGHSMGATIAFETTRIVAQNHGRNPLGLMVSARRAPHLAARKPPLHQLPDHAILGEIQRLGGTSADVLENQELMELLLPTLRADLQLAETYFLAQPAALNCPVAAFGGSLDPDITDRDLAAWREITSGDFRLHMLEGGHFFINSARVRLISLVLSELERWAG